jgi:septal ring factor EnvC (AmiA/AmiB activator)
MPDAGPTARCAPLLVYSGLLLACMALAASPQKTEAQLRSLRQKIEKMTQEVSRDALQRDRLSADLRASELSVGEARGELSRLSREYTDRSERRNALGAERVSQQRALVQERQSLSGELRAAYMIGPAEPLKLLLSAQDPLRSARLFAYYGYLGRARAREISEIQQHVQHVNGLDSELAQQQSELAGLRSQQQSELQHLERSRNERQKVLASLESQARTREQSLQRLKIQQADLEQLLSRLNHSLKAVPPPETASAFGSLRGRLEWPVTGRVTATFGEPRASGVRWDGIVVATELGAPVHAVSGGRVVYADWLPGLGLLAIVDHGAGYLSLYGHNERLYKATGESVTAGEVIAAAGDSGGRPQPELYFEIRREGRPVDPRPWFREHRPGAD